MLASEVRDQQIGTSFRREVARGQRFEFGKNWALFLKAMSAERIELAKGSLEGMLGVNALSGKSFLDVGSGSGLFSLAACELGARVRSFDYDPNSVACAEKLRDRYRAGDADWVIEQGSVLDAAYLRTLGEYDVVYSWGVLHHTGAMWQALANVAPLVKPGGALFVALYNDQGLWSQRWRKLKLIYNRLPAFLRAPYTILVMGAFELKSLVGATVRLRPVEYVRSWTRYASLRGRGMSRWHDMVDWVGGYPFEVAKPEQVFRFYRDLGFHLVELSTRAGGLGCNQYVFRKPCTHELNRTGFIGSPAL